MFNRLWRLLTGPWCAKHPTERVQRIMGCEECFKERCVAEREQRRQQAERKRERRVREIADGVKLAMTELS